jgi:hypothetical protein
VVWGWLSGSLGWFGGGLRVQQWLNGGSRWLGAGAGVV